MIDTPSNPYVSPKRWEDMAWEEYDQPDMVTSMLLRGQLRAQVVIMKKALGEIERESTDPIAVKVAGAALKEIAP